MDSASPSDPQSEPPNESRAPFGPGDTSGSFRSPLDRYRFEFRFTGHTGEYFRIWIVNVALTVVTLGIYAAWAKVRTRRYLYANTILDGHAFDYVAKPTRILIGNLIVMAAAGLYLLMMEGLLHPGIFFGAVIVGFLAFPFLVYKSICFRAVNSMYRNVRFRFRGKLKEAYSVYLGWAILCGLIGLLYPFWAHRKKQYVYGRLYFGGKPFRFFGESGKFFAFYFYAFLMGLGAFIVYSIFQVGLIVSQTSTGETGVEPSDLELFFTFLPMLFFWIAYVFLQQFVYGCVTKYTFENIELLGDFRFRNSMTGIRLAWISFSNLILALLSLGLLIPWGRIRKTRYMVENLVLETRNPELSAYIDESAREEQALGDAAVDFMDFEVGW